MHSPKQCSSCRKSRTPTIATEQKASGKYHKTVHVHTWSQMPKNVRVDKKKFKWITSWALTMAFSSILAKKLGVGDVIKREWCTVWLSVKNQTEV